ncbi:PREDICTED: 26S proteasome non-ATPase regulatory subunit 5-like [Nicrophorus vespilloides]|uniref:26S proteasome non-ATPase regulatory subunit 5 n=1 Tax=Nicrophorus vespilloides TaxID=110193 RepID=A0ABM1N5E4_NICVS|nr:PREDICTED: 26S proteasome non-ATPase regulatory subunit 5-like [Nicrophorus vespilloides]
MASKEDWCADKLSKLLNEDLRISTLNEIKEHFQEVSDSEATQTAEILQLPLVFDCLNDSNSEQVDLACEVLSLCLEKLDIAETTNRYSIPLERALTHPNSGVKLMALNEISRLVKCENARKHQLVSELSKRLLLTNVIKCVGVENLQVAVTASNIIVCFGTIATDSLLTSNVLSTIREMMAINEIVRLRFYELFVDICSTSREAHNKIVSAGLLSPMMNEITSKDVLLRLNIIEIISKLVKFDYGYDYLDNESCIDRIFRQIMNADDPIFQQLCEPGILKFFGHMAHCKPNQVFNKYPQIFDKIFVNLESSDYTAVKVSLETLAYIASSDKAIIDSFVGDKMTRAIRSISNRLQNLPTKDKVLILCWMEDLLKVNGNEIDSEICLKWFEAFSQNPMDLVMHFVHNPFEEVRLGGLGIINSLSAYVWGQTRIKQFPGLIEFLMNRTVETSKIVKELKYSIIANLVANDFNVFQIETVKQFENFLKEGTFYVQAATEIAFESNE